MTIVSHGKRDKTKYEIANPLDIESSSVYTTIHEIRYPTNKANEMKRAHTKHR